MPAYGQYSSYNPAIKASRNSAIPRPSAFTPFTGRPAQTQPGAGALETAKAARLALESDAEKRGTTAVPDAAFASHPHTAPVQSPDASLGITQGTPLGCGPRGHHRPQPLPAGRPYPAAGGHLCPSDGGFVAPRKIRLQPQVGPQPVLRNVPFLLQKLRQGGRVFAFAYKFPGAGVHIRRGRRPPGRRPHIHHTAQGVVLHAPGKSRGRPPAAWPSGLCFLSGHRSASSKGFGRPLPFCAPPWPPQPDARPVRPAVAAAQPGLRQLVRLAVALPDIHGGPPAAHGGLAHQPALAGVKIHKALWVDVVAVLPHILCHRLYGRGHKGLLFRISPAIGGRRRGPVRRRAGPPGHFPHRHPARQGGAAFPGAPQPACEGGRPSKGPSPPPGPYCDAGRQGPRFPGIRFAGRGGGVVAVCQANPAG